MHLKTVKVYASCTAQLIEENSTEFINIEEDINGHDLLTYKCPLCKETHQSERYG